MATYLTARQTGEELGIGHLEVIRRIRRGDIRAKKFGWNWAVPRDEIDRVREADWYRRVMAKRQLPE